MRVLVTGGAGFAGRRLVALLRARGHAVDYTARDESDASFGVWHLRLPDEARLGEILRAVRPDAVVHLAGMSFVPDAAARPREALEVNLEGTLGLLRVTNAVDPEGRMHLVHVSTSHVYAAPSGTGEVVLSELSPLGPASHYARTKLAAELAVTAWGGEDGRRWVVFRPFNHVGPGQRPEFVVSGWARQLARIERGESEPVIVVGSLAIRRDFCDVDDVAEAYALAAEGRVSSGVYNLASGTATRLEDILAVFRRLARRAFEVRVDQARVREGEAVSLRGDAAKIERECGWRARRPLEESIESTLNWWREHGEHK